MSRTSPASGRRGLPFIGSFRADLLAIELGKHAWQATTLEASKALFTNFEFALGAGRPRGAVTAVRGRREQANPEWLELHHRQTASVTNGTVVPLPGEHYLHHTHVGEIADGVKEWEAGSPSGLLAQE
ncbi:hypothetical protein [Paenarthrobacter nitroguajacolicus]|uniref:hypothetical protein n=1 Tax=Paenarthrobacter nitroguajacolicus TaxID=211146 RepID=UPI00344395E3